MSETDDKYLVNIKTVQSGAFRVLVEALKEILTDTNIIFDETGIKLIATDNSHIVLIHMKLNAENFLRLKKIQNIKSIISLENFLEAKY